MYGPGKMPTDGRYSMATSIGALMKLNSRPAMPATATPGAPPPVETPTPPPSPKHQSRLKYSDFASVGISNR